MNINNNVNTTSLDQLILTSAPATPEIQNLLLYSAGGIDGLQLAFNKQKRELILLLQVLLLVSLLF